MTCQIPADLLDASIGYISDRMRLQILVDLVSDLNFIGKVDLDDVSIYGEPNIIPASLDQTIRSALGSTLRRRIGTCGGVLTLSRMYRQIKDLKPDHVIDAEYCNKIRKAIPFRMMLEGLSRL